LKNLEVIPIYIYFDLKRDASQTADQVAASLLKQIVWPPESDSHFLREIYEKLNINSPRPSLDDTLELITLCTRSVNVRILFDALDECNENELGKVYNIIQTLLKANIGVYVTTRPHIIGLLRKRFSDAIYMENIYASKDDVRKVLIQRISEHRDVLESDLINEILSKIGSAQGMYQLLVS